METMIRHTLGGLADPDQYIGALKIEGRDPQLLVKQLRMMMKIRVAEERIGDMVQSGKIACPCHLAIGQEAAAVGVATHLKTTDRVFGAHRSHAHFLSQGGDLRALFAEVLGKSTGCSKGMGGSMHLYDEAHGFKGSVPIVAGTVSLAVGAALAAQKDKGTDVGISYFGDGAAEEGSVHESLNFASVFKLPMLFVCENNLFSSHLHIRLRQPADSIARYAAPHSIPAIVVDGNDVLAVADAALELLSRARKGGGPGFLEAVTYRWRGHVGPREDIDVGLKRNSDLTAWKQRDPVRRLEEALDGAKILSQTQLAQLKDEVSYEIERAWNLAEADPYPENDATLRMVYAQD